MSRRLRPTERRAYVSNYPELQAWLRGRDARCMWQQARTTQTRAEDPDAFVECWLIGCHLVILVIHADSHGWELYTAEPTCANDIAVTLADANLRTPRKVPE